MIDQPVLSLETISTNFTSVVLGHEAVDFGLKILLVMANGVNLQSEGSLLSLPTNFTFQVVIAILSGQWFLVASPFGLFIPFCQKLINRVHGIVWSFTIAQDRVSP